MLYFEGLISLCCSYSTLPQWYHCVPITVFTQKLWVVQNWSMDHSVLNHGSQNHVEGIKKRRNWEAIWLWILLNFNLQNRYVFDYISLLQWFITYNFCHTCIFLLTGNNLDTTLLLLKCSAHFQLKSNFTYNWQITLTYALTISCVSTHYML